MLPSYGEVCDQQPVPPEIKINADKVYTGEFPLSSLAPGDYVLDVTINDKTAAASASKQLRFTIY